MNAQPSLDLSQSAARAALPYAAGFAAVLTLTGLIPCCGFLVFPAGAAGMAYLVTPKLGVFPTPQAKTNFALYIGLGIGAMAAAALLVSSIVGGLLSLALGSVLVGLFANSPLDVAYTAGSGIVQLIFNIIGSIFAGVLFGILFSFLGSYFALDRNQGTQGYGQPF